MGIVVAVAPALFPQKHARAPAAPNSASVFPSTVCCSRKRQRPRLGRSAVSGRRPRLRLPDHPTSTSRGPATANTSPYAVSCLLWHPQSFRYGVRAGRINGHRYQGLRSTARRPLTFPPGFTRNARASIDARPCRPHNSFCALLLPRSLNTRGYIEAQQHGSSSDHDGEPTVRTCR